MHMKAAKPRNEEATQSWKLPGIWTLSGSLPRRSSRFAGSWWCAWERKARRRAEYIAEVLEEAGLRVSLTTQADAEDLYEEEFRDLLHFATLEEAEMCLVRLDELLRKFRSEGEKAAVERVLEVARLGRRRAEMIARNPRVDAQKARGKTGDPAVVRHLAQDARGVFRLAGGAQAVAGLPAALRRTSAARPRNSGSCQKWLIGWRWKRWIWGWACAACCSN